jgi:RNA polymerase sigma factor (sigma-70 family)
VIIDTKEKDLLERLAKNDQQAIQAIYKDNFNMVRYLVVNNNGTSDDAKDIFQEAMMVLYEKSKSNAFELTCLIKTYLYSVSRRLWLKRLQQIQRLTPQLESLSELVPIEEAIEQHQQRNFDFLCMEKAMLSLGEPCKSLLEAYYLQSKDMASIATSFGYTNADNAKNQKYKCLARLKKLFFAQHKTSTP